MRLTGLIWTCPHCNEEFEVFSDDGGLDQTVCWNWCPKCKKKVNIWIHFKGSNEHIKRGMTASEAGHA